MENGRQRSQERAVSLRLHVPFSQQVRLSPELWQELRRLTGGHVGLAQEVLDALPAGELTLREVISAPVIRHVQRGGLPGEIAAHLGNQVLALALLEDITVSTADIAVQSVAPGNDIDISGLLQAACDDGILIATNDGWVMPPLMKAVLAQELFTRHGAGTRSRFVDALIALDDEALLGELIVQARRARRWEDLADIWSKYQMLLATRFSAQTNLAYRNMPARARGQHLALRFAWVMIDMKHANPTELGYRKLLHAVASAAAGPGQEWKSIANIDTLAQAATLTIGSLWATGEYATAQRYADAVAEEIRHRLARQPPTLPSSHNVGLLHLHAGIAHFMANNPSRAIDYLEEAVDEGTERAEGNFVVVGALGVLALIHHYKGSPASSQRALLAYGDYDHSPQLYDHTIRQPARVTESLIALDRLDPEPPHPELFESIEASEPPEIWPHLARASTYWELASGRANVALSRLHAWELSHGRELSPGYLPARYIVRLRAEALMSVGRLQSAYEQLRRYDGRKPDTLVPLARLYAIGGFLDQAVRTAEFGLYDTTIGPEDRADLAAILACVQLRDGDDGKALELALESLHLCAEAGSALPLVRIPQGARRHIMTVLKDLGLDKQPGATTIWDKIAETHPLTGEELRERVWEHRDIYPGEGDLVFLSRAERNIVAQLGRDDTVPQIAARLSVSPNTLKKQIAVLYRKLEVKSKTDAVARLESLGLLPPPPPRGLGRV